MPTMTSKSFLRPLFVALIIASVAGCASTGPNQRVFMGSGNTFKANGLLISELQSDTFGPGVARLTIKSQADGNAVDKLVSYYTTQAALSVTKGDAEGFAVAWFLAKKLASARLEQLASTEAFVNTLASAQNGVGALPGGARVFLPSALTATRTPIRNKSKRAAIEDFFMDLPGTAVAIMPNWADAPKVAAVGDALKGILSTVSTGGARLDGSALNAMKIGSAYSVADSLGNKYIVEKTTDGIILHNPNSGPTKVDLNQLNFMPLLEKPDQYRYDAAKIVRNINSIFDGAMMSETRTGGRVSLGGHYSIAPNVLKLGDKIGYLNADGSLATADLPSVRKLYAENRAFKLAVDLTTKQDLEKDNQFINFKHSCSNRSFRERHGDALEYATYSCRDSKNNTTYSRTFVIGNNFATQGWDSLLKDKGYVDALKSAAQSAKVAEAFAAITPVLGNLDGASRCVTGDSFVYQIANNALSSDVNSDVRKLLAYSEPLESPSAVAKVLDCAQGVAGVGNVRRALSGGANLLKMNGIFTSPKFTQTTDMMSLFDSKIYTRNVLENVVSKASEFSSPTAALLTKVFYDHVQHANDIGELYDAVSKTI